MILVMQFYLILISNSCCSFSRCVVSNHLVPGKGNEAYRHIMISIHSAWHHGMCAYRRDSIDNCTGERSDTCDNVTRLLIWLSLLVIRQNLWWTFVEKEIMFFYRLNFFIIHNYPVKFSVLNIRSRFMQLARSSSGAATKISSN